jgi:ATPase subunit of ABC transporter with duplicated ATPase domains
VAAGGRLLLAGVDLVVAPGDRLGLVGPNGSGKSTFLQVVAGLRAAEAGQVLPTPAGAAVGYLPQESRPLPGETVRGVLERRTGVAEASAALDAATTALADRRTGERALHAYAAALDRWLARGGADLHARAGAVAADLGLPAGLLDQPTARLSGGQVARVQLAALMLARFDVFLLDEPTNDLDLDGLDRLEQLVLGLAAPLVIVSHDRAFLERTVTAVVEIDDHALALTRYDGGWLSYLEERARARQHAEQDYRSYVERRDALVDRARSQRRWASRGVGRARRSGETDKLIRHRNVESSESLAAQARRTERALARLTPLEKPWEAWDLRFAIADAGRSGDKTGSRGARRPPRPELGGPPPGRRTRPSPAARLSGAVVVLGSADQPGRRDGGPEPRGHDRARFTLGPVSLDVGWRDRVALVGPNGSGKTTLLCALLGRVPLAAGSRWLGPAVVVGEIDQRRDLFDRHASLLDGFVAHAGIAAAGGARSVLAKFGLGADHVMRPPASLSPGERTRATLAALQARGVNLLVLDEPTNHLDLPAIQQLEQALQAYAGTLILVTHDRRLFDAVGIGRVIDVLDGEVHERR